MGLHLCDECIHAARPVRETKASRATDYDRGLAYRQNTSDLSIPPTPVKRAAKERLNSWHVHKCTGRIIELSFNAISRPATTRVSVSPLGNHPRKRRSTNGRRNDNLQRLCDSSTGTVQHLLPLFTDRSLRFVKIIQL